VIIVSGIYVIRNKKTNKVYIGSSQNIRKRINEHRNDLIKGKHHNKYLQNSWNKYGEKTFEFKILERCEIDMLLGREQFWIDTIGNKLTYNICQSTAAPMKGLKHSSETLARMSAAHTGIRHTDESRRKISEGQRGRKLSEAQIELMRRTRKGKKATEETRSKLRIIHANPSAELRHRFGNAMRGKKRTPESLQKYTETRSQDFIVTSPDGNEVLIKGLARFCRENGLDQGMMSRVMKTGRTHKGWKCRRP